MSTRRNRVPALPIALLAALALAGNAALAAKPDKAGGKEAKSEMKMQRKEAKQQRHLEKREEKARSKSGQETDGDDRKGGGLDKQREKKAQQEQK
ncbi:MAG: hypothetical protein B0D85_01750, partial [Candidatus Sedimenticola endophacoides]